MDSLKKVAAYLGLDNTSAIGVAMIAGIVMVIIGGIIYMLGVYLVATVNNAIPAGSATSVGSAALFCSSRDTSLTNIANAFNIVGIGVVVGGIVAILYEVIPLAAMFMGRQR